MERSCLSQNIKSSISHHVEQIKIPLPQKSRRFIMNLGQAKFGIFSFIIVLLLMPLGHTLMILTEELFPAEKFFNAFLIGAIGVFLFAIGIRNNTRKAMATIFGLLAGILVWTGWVEFSFVWVAEKLHVAPLMEDGQIATKPEYLVMVSSLGLLASIILVFLFTYTRCQFFNWFQKVFGIRKHIKVENIPTKPIAVITFIETIMVLWTFYLVLLLVYDKDLAGDKHPITYLVAFGSLFWSAYLFLNLIKIQKFDYAIRYAIPTVIIFWNFVEVLGRWNLFKEIWIHPSEHWAELSIIFALLILFIFIYVRENYLQNRRQLE
jgi:hypothetical protein